MNNVEERQNESIEDIQADVTAHLNINPDDHHMPVVKQLMVIFGLLVLIFGSSYIPEMLAFVGDKRPDVETLPAQTPTTKENTSNVEPIDEAAADPFEDIAISAQSAYVWDVKAQRALYNKNADEQLPLASVTKLMTGLVAYELLGDGVTVNVTRDAVYQEGDSGLMYGEEFSMQNLIDLTLMSSSNDGAYALAAAGGASLGVGDAGPGTFIEAMNIRAEEIGLSQTYFRNPTGLDISQTEAGAYGSARDMAFLLEHIVTNSPEVLEYTTKTDTRIINEQGLYHDVENTNQTVNEIPNIIASKTGYTTLAGGNLVIAFDAGLNRPIIVSVLGSTRSGRFRDTLNLAEAAMAAINQE